MSKQMKNKSNDRVLGGRRGWLAMGTLAAYAVMGSSKPALAEAAKGVSGGSSAAGAKLPVKRFDIGAGPLDAAIKEYEAATGLTVTTTLWPPLLRPVEPCPRGALAARGSAARFCAFPLPTAKAATTRMITRSISWRRKIVSPSVTWTIPTALCAISPVCSAAGAM